MHVILHVIQICCSTQSKKIRSETMHSSGARMSVKTQPGLVGRRENAARACSPTFPNRVTGWKPPARAPGSQLGALLWWPRVACMHSGTARTFLPYISHRKALLISPRSTVLQLQVARFSYC